MCPLYLIKSDFCTLHSRDIHRQSLLLKMKVLIQVWIAMSDMFVYKTMCLSYLDYMIINKDEMEKKRKKNNTII